MMTTKYLELWSSSIYIVSRNIYCTLTLNFSDLSSLDQALTTNTHLLSAFNSRRWEITHEELTLNNSGTTLLRLLHFLLIFAFFVDVNGKGLFLASSALAISSAIAWLPLNAPRRSLHSQLRIQESYWWIFPPSFHLQFLHESFAAVLWTGQQNIVSREWNKEMDNAHLIMFLWASYLSLSYPTAPQF